jgi:hypothetical protein
VLRIDAAHAAGDASRPHRTVTGDLVQFDVGANRLAVPKEFEADEQALVARLADLPESLDLTEPFGRIHEAIAEAQKGAR